MVDIAHSRLDTLPPLNDALERLDAHFIHVENAPKNWAEML
jgi:hypothetical protein